MTSLPDRPRRRTGPTVALIVVLGLGLVVAAAAARVGWGYLERHRTYAPSTPLTVQCDDVPADAERVTLTGVDGFTLGAALVGPSDAAVGLVLRQGASQKICEWLPWAGRVADETGARVLLFDRRGRGSSPGQGNLSAEPEDTRRAVAHLRSLGIEKVALAASSMGNSIMFATLPDLEPPPCAVLAISPVLTSGDSQGVVDGSALTGLPENVWVTWETEGPGVAANAARIVERVQPGEVHALPVDTHHHSRQLVLRHASVQRFFLEAVRSC